MSETIAGGYRDRDRRPPKRIFDRMPIAKWLGRADPFDLATWLLLAALVAIALWTYHDYAVSNDEGLQHHYGELILQYYRSGFTDRAVFNFRDLYLYGGLFDIVAVRLAELFPSVDLYDIRHILCALIGIGGISATAATARTIAGPRAGFIAAVALAACGCWYGGLSAGANWMQQLDGHAYTVDPSGHGLTFTQETTVTLEDQNHHQLVLQNIERLTF